MKNHVLLYQEDMAVWNILPSISYQQTIVSMSQNASNQGK